MKEYEIDCVFCSKKIKLYLDEKKAIKSLGGDNVKKAFPDMSEGEIVLMVENICPLCQKKVLGGDEE